MVAAIINILIGLGMMATPALFGLSRAAANNVYIVFPLIITFAITSLWEINRSARYLNVAMGAWLLVAPFVLSLHALPTILNILSGGFVIILSLIPRRVKGKYGGGWASLFQKNPTHLQ